MNAKVELWLTAGTMKKLLSALSKVEDSIPYDYSEVEISICNVEIDSSPAEWTLFATELNIVTKIQAIKEVRSVSSCGLKEAKEAVEAYDMHCTPVPLGKYASKRDAMRVITLLKDRPSLVKFKVRAGNGPLESVGSIPSAE
jgi:ribosomal protein L7/L12